MLRAPGAAMLSSRAWRRAMAATDCGKETGPVREGNCRFDVSHATTIAPSNNSTAGLFVRMANEDIEVE